MDSSRFSSLFAVCTIGVLTLMGCSGKGGAGSDLQARQLDGQELTSLFRDHCLKVVEFERIMSDSRSRIKKHCGFIYERARTTNCALQVGSVVDWVLKYQVEDEVQVRYSWPLGLYGEEVGEPTRENLSCAISVDAHHEADMTRALRSAIAEVSQIGTPIYTSDAGGGEYWYWNQRYQSYDSFMITAGRIRSTNPAQPSRFVLEIAPVRDPSMFGVQN